MRVYIINIGFESTSHFQGFLNHKLEEFEEEGKEIVDIQVEYRGFESFDMPRPYHYFVTIVYKEPKE